MIFYNLVVNNYYEFGAYEANISMLRISPYSYAEDIETYRANASLGVGKIDYIVATGISQKNIPDQLELESYLKLDQLKPLQSSYTQSTSAGESAATPEKDTSNSVAATDEDKKTTEVSNEKTN